MAQAGPQGAQDVRYEWLDYAKAIGICLVVLAHVAGGIRKGPAGDSLERWWIVIDLIYTFHMPLFFGISGFLFARRPTLDVSKFAKSSLISVVAPYLLWGLIYVSVQNLFPGASNNLTGMSRLLSILYDPIAHLWFLYVLFFVRIGYFAVYKTGRVDLFASLIVVSSAIYLLTTGFQLDAKKWAMGFAFYGLGAVLARSGVEAAVRPVHLRLCLAASVALWFAFAFGVLRGGLPLVVLAAAAVAGVVMTLLVSYLLPQSDGRAARAFAFLGQASLAIYVAHTIFAAGTRAVLYKLGVIEPFFNVFAGTVVGLLLPAVLFWGANRLHVAPYLGLGQNQTRLYLSARAPRLASSASTLR